MTMLRLYLNQKKEKKSIYEFLSILISQLSKILNLQSTLIIHKFFDILIYFLLILLLFSWKY